MFFFIGSSRFCKDLVRDRLQASGRRVGVKVNPQRLRHTFATQLVNAGCRITTIQMLLGHKRLNTTLTYARVYDRTVAEDYYTAMAVVEKRLEPHLIPLPEPQKANGEFSGIAPSQAQELVELVDALQGGSPKSNQLAILEQLREKIEHLFLPVVGNTMSSQRIVKVLPTCGQLPDTICRCSRSCGNVGNWDVCSYPHFHQPSSKMSIVVNISHHTNNIALILNCKSC